MADLVITAANVLAGAGATISPKTAGATITAGQVVYEDTSDGGKLKLARGNAVGTANVYGIALNNASNGQPCSVIRDGDNFNPGATVVVGTTYALSAAVAGAIAPDGDLVATNVNVTLGIATTTSNIKLAINPSGVAKA